METKLLIADKFEEGTVGVQCVLNPRTGAVIADLAKASPKQVEDAVAAASRWLRAGQLRVAECALPVRHRAKTSMIC